MSETGSTSVVFPSEGYQVLSTLVHLLGCSVLSFCFARRLEWTSLSKFCAMAIFFDSWLFVFSGGVVVSGIGMSLNDAACLSGVYLCIIFYGSSKMLIYVFLSEKVHVVWSADMPVRRFQSRIWILCAIVLLGYVVIFVLMMIGRIGYLQPPDPAYDGGRRTCIIGLEPMASIPLLSYDVFLNIFLTSLFAYPLLGGSHLGNHVNLQKDGRKLVNPKLRALAKRTCYAAGIALGTSVVNILILTLLHGRQLGWVCLASCGFDVTVNAIVIFLITRKVHGDDPPSSKPRRAAALDKETNMPDNHVILTRHLGITDDVDGTTSTTPGSHRNHGHGATAATFNVGVVGGRDYGDKKSSDRDAAFTPKHRKTLSSSNSKSSPPPLQGNAIINNIIINTKRTRPSAGQKGGYGNGSELDSRGATVSFSQIGDFAVTLDDGDRNGTVSRTSNGVGAGSDNGVLSNSNGVALPSASASASSHTGGGVGAGAGAGGGGSGGWAAGFRASRGKKDQQRNDGQALQMVPVLLHGRGDSRSSLDDLKEEDTEPNTPNSFTKVHTIGGDGYK